MGVYINMEMPTSCDMCWALDDYGDYPRCRITEEQRGYNFRIREKRMDKCPLVPVPEHGRLIDADALTETTDGIHDCCDIYFQPIDNICGPNDCNGCKWRETMDCFRRMVKHAPTIIPADPAEEGE